MSKEIMDRRAADNPYLHKDFHGALSSGIDYVADRFGERAVRDYLYQFADVYYAPLKEQMKRRGLVALKEHIENTYKTEGGRVAIDFSETEMTVRVAACPAVMHMREKGYKVSPHFVETTGTVNKAICEGTGYAAELVEYDEETGRSIQRFTKIKKPQRKAENAEGERKIS